MNQQVPDELISAYFDGEVTRDERGQIERLLNSSVECRQMLDDTAKLSALLHSFPREAAPVQLSKNIQQKIANIVVQPAAQDFSSRRSLRREWMAFGAGITATMASLLLWISLHPVNPPAHELAHTSTTRPTTSTPSPATAVAASNAPKAAVTTEGYSLELAGTSDSTNSQQASSFNKASSPLVAAPAQVSLQTSIDGENGFVDEMKLPQQREEFLESLKNGAIIEQHILDPNNVVMVVELTVIDVDKGIEGLQLLLQKRNLHRAENGDTSAKSTANELKPSPASATNLKPVGSDGLVAIYVRASGTELAEMLSESVKNQPEIYRDLVPQLPMEFPWKQTSPSSNVASRDSKPEPTNSVSVSENRNEPSSVAVEANLVVQSFAVSNGLAVDNSLNANPEILKQFHYKPAAKFGSSPVAKIAVLDEDSVSSPETNEPKPTPRPDVRKRGRLFEKTRHPTAIDSNGFAEFRLAIDQDQQQSEPVPALAIPTSRPGSDGTPSDKDRPQGMPSQTHQENGVPSLMRMLILVRPAKPLVSP